MEKPFGIAITGVDVNGTVQSSVHKDLFKIPFRLSSKPTKDWRQFFEHEYSDSLRQKKCEFRVTDDSIVLECALVDAQEQLDFLKTIIATVNKDYTAHMFEVVRSRSKEASEREALDVRKQNILGKLRF